MRNHNGWKNCSGFEPKQPLGGQAAGLRMARKSVDRAISKRGAISATEILADLSSALMVLISLGVSFGGRSPVRPQARAEELAPSFMHDNH